MKTPARILIVAALAVAVVAVVAIKRVKSPGDAATAIPVTAAKLPRLVDVGAGKCIPCRMMAPILEELKREYAGRMNVEFVDVWVNPDAGKPYGIEMIPTQIFFDAEGRELFRHVGFFGKEDILAKWKELGVDLSAPPSAAAEAANQVVAFYFHGTVRCETCLKIEQQAKEVIERQFQTELSSSQLALKSVNYEQPQNTHFLQDYKLPCPSLVLVRQKEGKAEQWKRLDDTWKLVEDPVKFSRYVETEVRKFLNGQEPQTDNKQSDAADAPEDR